MRVAWWPLPAAKYMLRVSFEGLGINEVRSAWDEDSK